MANELFLIYLAGEMNSMVLQWSAFLAQDGRFNIAGVNAVWTQVREACRTNEPDVLLIQADIAPGPDQLAEFLATLKRAVAVVLLPPAWESSTGLIEAVHTVRKVFLLPVSPPDVLNFVYAAANTEKQRMHTASPTQVNGAGRQAMAAVGTKVIALISADGGTGKTTIADGLAFELAARRNIRTLLFSFNHPSPLALRTKGLARTRNAQEFFAHPTTGFAAAVQTTTDGLDILLAPDDPFAYATAGTIPPEEPHSIRSLILAAYTRGYGAILLDLPPGEDHWTLQPLLTAANALVVTRPTLDGIYATAYLASLITHKLASRHQLQARGIFSVLNFCGKGSSYNPNTFVQQGAAYVKSSASMQTPDHWFPPVIASFDYDPNVPRAQDNQRPAADLSATFAASIQALADNFFPALAAEPARRRRKVLLPGITVVKRSGGA